MKKILSMILTMLIMSLLLFSCDTKETENNDNTSNETSSIEETTSEEETSTIEPIEIKIAEDLIINENQLEAIGITEAELKSIYLNGKIFVLEQYRIFNNNKGKNVVLKLNSNMVKEIGVYNEVEVRDVNFISIEKGMDIFNVVEIAGIPSEIYNEIYIEMKTRNISMHYSYGEKSQHGFYVDLTDDLKVNYSSAFDLPG